ncbi:MAG TPA: hypothetical protein VN327_15715 [Pseudonocardiaceae bacterium]|nr:hypothetical protein [Pseudonocardiaceae bacterium]
MSRALVSTISMPKFSAFSFIQRLNSTIFVTVAGEVSRFDPRAAVDGT